MYLKKTETYPEVVQDNDIPADVLQKLQWTKNYNESQQLKIILNEEEYMEISDSLFQSIREIQDIDFEKIHEEHRKAFADKKELQNILYYATYKAIKDNHLGFNIFNDNDAKPLLNFKLKQSLLFRVVHAFDKFRDLERYNGLISDYMQYVLEDQEYEYDRDYIEREVMAYYSKLCETHRFHRNFSIEFIVNAAMDHYKSFLIHFGYYDPAYPPDHKWKNYYEVFHPSCYRSRLFHGETASDIDNDRYERESEDSFNWKYLNEF